MKPPLKPFTVEVKRARSHASHAKPVVSAPPVFAETGPAPAVVPPSQARQLAEQMFSSLTANPKTEPKPQAGAESVFRPASPKSETVDTLVNEPTPAWPAAKASPVSENVPPKARKRSASTTAAARVAKVATVRSKAPIAEKAPTSPSPKAPKRDLSSKHSDVPSSSMPFDQAISLSPDAEVAERNGHSWGWPLGERWKRRLRHLRRS